VPQASSNNIYFALPPQVTANLLFDVVGYSVVPDATSASMRDTIVGRDDHRAVRWLRDGDLTPLAGQAIR